MADQLAERPGTGGGGKSTVRYHDETDGTYSMAEASHLRYWNTNTLLWERATGTAGAIATSGAAGGGGAATIADGADVAQGTTTDLSSASTVIGILKAIKAAITGTVAVSGTFFQATQPVSGTFWQATQPVSLATNTPDVTDRAARLLGHVTVDSAPTTAVTMATQTPDVTDRAARLLGVVDKGKVWDGTNIAAVKAASALAAATDPALVVQHSPQRADASTLSVTATAAVNTALTLTLPAAAAGLFHYITSIQIVKLYSVVGVAAGAGNLITTTNLPGSPAWTTEQLASAAGTAVTVVSLIPTTPLKSSVAATNTTIVCPQQLQTIWRINVSYYTAP